MGAFYYSIIIIMTWGAGYIYFLYLLTIVCVIIKFVNKCPSCLYLSQIWQVVNKRGFKTK